MAVHNEQFAALREYIKTFNSAVVAGTLTQSVKTVQLLTFTDEEIKGVQRTYNNGISE